MTSASSGGAGERVRKPVVPEQKGEPGLSSTNSPRATARPARSVQRHLPATRLYYVLRIAVVAQKTSGEPGRRDHGNPGVLDL